MHSCCVNGTQGRGVSAPPLCNFHVWDGPRSELLCSDRVAVARVNSSASPGLPLLVSFFLSSSCFKRSSPTPLP